MAARDRLEMLLAPLVDDLGYEYVGIEYSSNPKNRVLRLYIDRSGDGVNLEDCETVSREVSALLDVEEPIPGQYTLEVSSPGVERPLFTAEHFRAHVGEQARVQMLVPVDGRRKFKGTIVSVDDGMVCLEVDDRQWMLPLAEVGKARLAPDLDMLFADREQMDD